jgi:hypothetical protein
MGRSDDFEVVSVILDDRGEADTGKDLVESVADVFEFVVEFLAVVLEPVLEAFQEVGGEVGAVAAGIAVGGDGLEALRDEEVVPGR